MATQKAKKGARKARKMKDLPTRSAANVKGGTKSRYDVNIDSQVIAVYSPTKIEPT
jgi:hypothetical protein